MFTSYSIAFTTAKAIPASGNKNFQVGTCLIIRCLKEVLIFSKDFKINEHLIYNAIKTVAELFE